MGGTYNFQTSLFFDPRERVGVFIAANVINALDAFSSPHGADPLDGVTVRAMAQTVLSLATYRPLPDQGRGIRRSYLIFDVVLLVLTVVMIISLIRIPVRYRRLRDRGIHNRNELVRRIGLITLLHFVWPFFLLYFATQELIWKVLGMFQPDFVYWIQAVAVIVVLKRIFEIGLLLHVFKDIKTRFARKVVLA